jgi:hypothetical protein
MFHAAAGMLKKCAFLTSLITYSIMQIGLAKYASHLVDKTQTTNRRDSIIHFHTTMRYADDVM